MRDGRRRGATDTLRDGPTGYAKSRKYSVLRNASFLRFAFGFAQAAGNVDLDAIEAEMLDAHVRQGSFRFCYETTPRYGRPPSLGTAPQLDTAIVHVWR